MVGSDAKLDSQCVECGLILLQLFVTICGPFYDFFVIYLGRRSSEIGQYPRYTSH